MERTFPYGRICLSTVIMVCELNRTHCVPKIILTYTHVCHAQKKETWQCLSTFPVVQNGK